MTFVFDSLFDSSPVSSELSPETVGCKVRIAAVILEATLSVTFGLTVDDIVEPNNPFPTLSDAFKTPIRCSGVMCQR